MKPLSSSQAMMLAMPITLPGATESACVATNSRAGYPLQRGVHRGEQHRRLSRPFTRASRDSAVMRCATTLALGDTRS